MLKLSSYGIAKEFLPKYKNKNTKNIKFCNQNGKMKKNNPLAALHGCCKLLKYIH